MKELVSGWSRMGKETGDNNHAQLKSELLLLVASKITISFGIEFNGKRTFNSEGALHGHSFCEITKMPSCSLAICHRCRRAGHAHK
jgi:hypothetical protein